MQLKTTLRRGLLLPLALALVATGCDKDINEHLSGDMAVYQQYEVFINGSELPGAFANFRDGSAFGERVQVDHGTALCNAMEMFYVPSVGADDPEFNYAVQLERNHTFARFTFKRSGKETLVNEIVYNDVPELKAPAIDEIVSGQIYEFDMTSVPADFDVEISLSPSQTLIDGTTARAEVNRAANEFSFFGLKSGTYTLRVDVVKTAPTVMNDTPAGGLMRVVRRSSRNEVKVPVGVL